MKLVYEKKWYLKKSHRNKRGGTGNCFDKNQIFSTKSKKNGQNTFTVEKGSLLVEGYINQCIEYISEQSTFHDNVHQLIQNIVLELIIQVIQEQEVQVKIK